MLFSSAPELPPRRRAERPLWRRVLLGAAAIGVLASAQPWIRVKIASLFAPFGNVFGPPAWHSSAGFTLLCTCALLIVLTLAETQTRSSSQAVRPASLMLVVVMLVCVGAYAGEGPGMLRGVTACWTYSFYIGGAAAVLLLAASAARAQANGRAQQPRDSWR